MDIKSYAMNFIKHNQWAYNCFNACGRIAVKLCGVFVQPDDKLILFNSFGGKKFDDSTREIYLFMKNDLRFSDYKMLWAFHAPEEFPEIENKIKSDNLSYFITALKARCWITNSSIQRGIEFKGKHTYYFNTWHGTPLKKMGALPGKKGNNRIMQSCDTILAQSKYEAEQMAQAYEIPLSKYKIYGLPRNDVLAAAGQQEKRTIRQELGIDPEDFVVISVGEIIKRKNHETAIRAFAKAQIPHTVYVICGSGILQEQLSRLIKTLNIEGKIKFIGFRADAKEIIKIADVCVFPSYQEGLSMALMEAMAAGLPCVASNIRGNVDLIDEGKGGYLCDPQSAEDFAGAMKKIESNRQDCIRMGQYNMEKIKHFDVSKVTALMEKIYSEQVNR